MQDKTRIQIYLGFLILNFFQIVNRNSEILPLNYITYSIAGAITTEAKSAVKEESPEEITATITTNSTRKI